jgi:hypothetical protein
MQAFPSYVSATVFLFPNVGGMRHRGVVVAKIAVVNKQRRVEHRVVLQRPSNSVCDVVIVHAVSNETL